MDKYIVVQARGTAVRMVTAVPPKVVDKYETDRYGELQEFTVCDTSVGDAVFHERGEYEVIVNEIIYGDAWYPDEYIFVAKRSS